MRFVWPIVAAHPRPYLGLGWWRPSNWRLTCGVRLQPTGHAFPSAPWGWRWLQAPDRPVGVCLPLWLYWPVYLWRYRWSILCDPLIAVGLWALEEEGGYYRDGRPTFPLWLRRAWWCFLHDRDRAPAPCWVCSRLAEGGRLTGFAQLYTCPSCVERQRVQRLAIHRACVALRLVGA